MMWREIVCVLIFGGCIWMTGGLKCLQCMDTSTGGDCVHDYEGLVDASQGVFQNGSRAYYKECPDGTYGVTQNFCVIEEFYVGGIVKSFIRDCSDGGNFSFTGDVNNPKLNQIVPDNYTTCIYRISANAHICVTLCEGDFCNGPLPPNDTETVCDESGLNATCGAGQLFIASGPFGPIVDRVLGRGFLVPLLAAILCINVFG